MELLTISASFMLRIQTRSRRETKVFTIDSDSGTMFALSKITPSVVIVATEMRALTFCGTRKTPAHTPISSPKTPASTSQRRCSFTLRICDNAASEETTSASLLEQIPLRHRPTKTVRSSGVNEVREAASKMDGVAAAKKGGVRRGGGEKKMNNNNKTCKSGLDEIR